MIIVNEAFAARYWPGRDPLAQRVRVGGDDGPWLRVVGVAANTKYSSRSEAAPPIMMLPFAQHYSAQAKLHLRTDGDPAALAPALREAIRGVDPALPILALGTLSERTGASLLPQQIAASLIGTFGTVALLLSLLGLYGVLARGVAQRSREIGIRLALGAAPRSILRLVIGQGWRLTAIGLAAGLALAAAGARLLGAFLPGVGALDAAAFAGAAFVLAAGASLAMWLPARRALAIDPAHGAAKRVTFPWPHHACIRQTPFRRVSTSPKIASGPAPRRHRAGCSSPTTSPTCSKRCGCCSRARAIRSTPPPRRPASSPRSRTRNSTSS